MTTESLSEHPHPNEFCFSSKLLLLEEDWKFIHPTDAETVLQTYPRGWQLICFRYLGRDGDYDIIDDGEVSFRVRDVVVVAIPEPLYKRGQRVYATRKQSNGCVRRIVWNLKRKAPYYILDVDGRLSRFWYYDSDLEPEKVS